MESPDENVVDVITAKIAGFIGSNYPCGCDSLECPGETAEAQELFELIVTGLDRAGWVIVRDYGQTDQP